MPSTSSGVLPMIRLSRAGPTIPRCSNDVRPLAPRDEIGLSDDVAADVPAGIGFPDRDDAIGIAIRQRLEHHAADDAQRRRRRTNAEGERQNRGHRKARGPDERPQRKPQILQQSAHHRLLRRSNEAFDGRRC